ncbi:G_PROTEIN_RECEP_F1_2 domain-containing protein [Caenorhabditis elegans]|uniref:G_PROTEIN_RECEP_F1_2 domain-containing protein n=2 Tax=Caenorhabditis elegans TaxID=6239 RepID=Q9U306_CAEEL|nr:G_PROTEIN_RECEP_F1_2 domain-containing protein [Caenorhabditis elegans]CAB60322.2 G_PROTEIN_RECEP_F1_2 domain-containing protein [Caenorhabditis elegans]|eukprot:NP_001041011.1 Serpentine Receptor, class V [Caenorhabditis elegans]
MITDLYSLPLVAQVGEPLDENLERIVETVQFSIFCFTLPFYVFVTYFLLDALHRGIDELSTPFFRLCITTAFLDIWTLLNNYLGAMFPKWGWGTSVYLFLDSYYAHAYLYFAWASGICQAMCVSLMATNRVSAILFPNRHSRIWSSTRLRIAIAVQFLPGLLAGLATFFNETQLYRNTKNGLIPRFKSENFIAVLFVIAGGFLATVCIYLIIAYCYLIFMLRKSSNAIKNTQFHKSRAVIKKKEVKLFFMSSITVAIQISILCLVIVYATSLLNFPLDKFYLFYNAISDLYAGINPYLLWIFSDSLRKHIWHRIGWRRTWKIPTSSVVTVNQI